MRYAKDMEKPSRLDELEALLQEGKVTTTILPGQRHG